MGPAKESAQSEPSASSPASPEALKSARADALTREYELLRQDERAFTTTMVSLGSLIAIVAGTSAFFLLRSCAVGHASGCHSYPPAVYAILPGPTIAAAALLVQQATTATIRGRIMLALERAIMAEHDEVYPLGSGYMPAFSSYRLQQPIVHGFRGVALWTLMFSLPFAAVVTSICYCGSTLPDGWQMLFYIVYGCLIVMLAWAGWPVLRGFHKVDAWLIAQHHDGQRSRRPA